jgi:hypothetical protein
LLSAMKPLRLDRWEPFVDVCQLRVGSRMRPNKDDPEIFVVERLRLVESGPNILFANGRGLDIRIGISQRWEIESI